MFPKSRALALALSLSLVFTSSHAKKELPSGTTPPVTARSAGFHWSHPATPLTEDFESATKTSYTAANVQLGSGSWFFNNALIGTLGNDQKDGAKSVRIKGTGSIRMNFDYTGGASAVTLKYALFGTDGSGTWELQVSSDGGNTFARVGNAVVNSSATLQTVTFPVNMPGNIRIAIVKTDGGSGRINIDDVEIAPFTGGSGSTGGGTTGADDDNMLM